MSLKTMFKQTRAYNLLQTIIGSIFHKGIPSNCTHLSYYRNIVNAPVV